MAQRVALGLEYDGRGFCGWQTQPGGCAIQDHVEAALAIIHGGPLATIVAGRTDAGVHATGQVLHFDAEQVRPASAWVRGVNTHLPSGVTVLWAQAVDAGFDARRSALERTYRYLLLNRPVKPALQAGRVGWVHGEVDEGGMAEAMQCLIGSHDFSAFRSSECQAVSPIREMRAASLQRQGDLLVFEFRANAFLHHQIRNLVGALVWIGLRRRRPEWMAELLASRDRTLGAATYAPDGLYLTAVRYDARFGLPEPQVYSPYSLSLTPRQP
jgi:tRNA pseudouridine38-40 synthase